MFNKIFNNIRGNKFQKCPIKFMYTWILCSKIIYVLKNKENLIFMFLGEKKHEKQK